jgi:hypothetical protein
MPSTLVHVAVGGLLGAALLGPGFDRRAAAVVFAAAALPDLDALTSLVLPGTHRALFHTLLLPAALAAVIGYDARVRSASYLRTRYGPRGVRLAWVSVVALVGGGILPDLFTNGVNAFYPIHDAFYAVNGRLYVSSHHGLVQTFVDLSPADPRPARTTRNFYYVTGVDPRPGPDPADAERIFPLASSGIQLMLVLLSTFVVAARLRENERADATAGVRGEANAERGRSAGTDGGTEVGGESEADADDSASASAESPDHDASR